jgi:hypothetical protein
MEGLVLNSSVFQPNEIRRLVGMLLPIFQYLQALNPPQSHGASIRA